VKELTKAEFAYLTQLVTSGTDGVKFQPGDEVDRAVLCEISEVVSRGATTTLVKLHPKMKILELLGRHLDTFVDKSEVWDPDGSPIQWANLIRLAKSDERDDESDF
jgi:phage terminase small subunit